MILAIAALAASGLALSLMAPPLARGATHVVTIGDGFFSPADLSVDVGDTVTWVNEDDSPHTATGDGFDSGNIDPGESFSFTFGSAGVFSYVCSYHEEMVGAIRVAAAAGAGTPAAPARTAAPAASTQAHGGAHDADQPDTAVPASASGVPAGWLATILIGLGLVAFAIACLPASRPPEPSPIRRADGWRR